MGGVRLGSSHKSRLRRRALLIGISEYEAGQDLRTPIADVALVKSALAARSFNCETLMQPTFEMLEAAVDSFAKKIIDCDFAIIFFAGHAFEHAGSGSVLPLDFPFPATGVGIHRYGYPVSRFEEALHNCKGTSILLLDACRTSLDDPEERRRWAEYTVSALPKRELDNFLIAWSTSSGSIAWDGNNNSLFATSFAGHALRHELHLEEMFASIGQEVQSGPHAQRSWYQSTLKQRYRLSDLPRYRIKQSIPTPLPSLNGSLCLARDPLGQRIAICGQSRSVFDAGNNNLFAIDSGTLGIKSLVEWSRDKIITVDSTSKMLVPTNNNRNMVLSDDPHGLRVSSGGKFAVLLYTAKIELVDLIGKRPRLKRRWHLDWDAYGATFSDKNIAWVVGSSGNIAKLDAQSGKLSVITEDNPWAGHLYDVSVMSDGDLVVVGGRGSVRIIRTKPGEPIILAPINPSSASRRPSVTLCPAFTVIFSQSYGKTDFLFCDISPTEPLLAAGSADGKVILIDLRDGSLVKKLNVSPERSSVQGLAFLANGTLAVLCMDATIKFAKIG